MTRSLNVVCGDCGHRVTLHKPGCSFTSPRRPRCGCERARIGLTPAETAVLRMMALDIQIKEAAFRLKLSQKTVEVHLANMRKKTGVRSTLGLILCCIRSGVLEWDTLPGFDIPVFLEEKRP